MFASSPCLFPSNKAMQRSAGDLSNVHIVFTKSVLIIYKSVFEYLELNAYFLTKFGADTATRRRQFAKIPPSSSGGPVLRLPGWGSVKNAMWVPSFSRALSCFPLFLGAMLPRRARYRS